MTPITKYGRRFAGLLAIALVVPACGGGGGSSGTSSSGSSPSISNLSLSPQWVYRDPAGISTVTGRFEFNDPDGDIVTATLTIVDRSGATSTDTEPIEGMEGATSGMIMGLIEIDAGTENDYAIRVFVTDSRGHSSNELATVFLVREPPWLTRTPMPTPRTGFFSAEVGGKIYVMGGALPGTGVPGTPTDLVEVYDPATDRWATGVSLPVPAAGFLAASVEGKIYAIGRQIDLSGVAWEFDPSEATWTNRSGTAVPFRAGITPLGGRILVLGGSEGFETSAVEVYDPSVDEWSVGTSLPQAREQPRGATLGGKAYAIGGFGIHGVYGGYFNETDEYDPGTGQWTIRAPMMVPRVQFGCAAVAGLVYAIGGENVYPALDSVEAFDPVAGSWMPKAPLPVPLTRMDAATINGKIYIVETGTTWEYTPENDLTGVTWAPAMPSVRTTSARSALSPSSRWSASR